MQEKRLAGGEAGGRAVRKPVWATSPMMDARGPSPPSPSPAGCMIGGVGYGALRGASRAPVLTRVAAAAAAVAVAVAVVAVAVAVVAFAANFVLLQ